MMQLLSSYHYLDQSMSTKSFFFSREICWVWIIFFPNLTRQEKDAKYEQDSCIIAASFPHRCERGAQIKLRRMNLRMHTINPQTPMSYDFTPP